VKQNQKTKIKKQEKPKNEKLNENNNKNPKLESITKKTNFTSFSLDFPILKVFI